MKGHPAALVDGLLLLGGCAALVGALGVGLVDARHPMFNDAPSGLLPLGLGAAIALGRRLGADAGPRQRVAFLVWSVAFGAWALSLGDRLGALPTRVIVFGVDGATFRVIDEHPLPNFQRMQAGGSRAVLRSMEPMFSPLLWTTMASGRLPEDHGIRGFHVQAPDCKVARWWDVAESEGRGVGLYKWLVDYPPRSFAHGGFWVPSWLAPAPETWPAELSVVKEVELANRLRRRQVESVEPAWRTAERLVGVGVRLSTLGRAARWKLWERFGPGDVRRNVEMQGIRGDIDRDVFIAQLYAEHPDLASLNYYATDGLAHLYWDRYEEGGDELLSAYRQADGILGELLDRLPTEGRLIVLSDHGFSAMDGNGLAGQFLPLTERLQARIGTQVGKVDVTRVGHKLVVGTSGPEAAAAVRAWVATLLDERGEPAFVAGEFPDDPGSVALTLADESITADRLAGGSVGGEPLKDYVTLSVNYTGTHQEAGVLLLYGDGLAAGARLPDARLLDVAPTILAAAGLPASAQMPGKAVGWPEVPRVPSWDGLLPGLRWQGGEAGGNEEMLEALGYSEGRKPDPAPP